MESVKIMDAPAKYSSKVWKYFGFEKNDQDKCDFKTIVCKECKAVLKYSGGTTNMSTHLRRHHGIVINNNKGMCVTYLFLLIIL
jgi:hypothetical protein